MLVVIGIDVDIVVFWLNERLAAARTEKVEFMIRPLPAKPMVINSDVALLHYWCLARIAPPRKDFVKVEVAIWTPVVLIE